MNSFQFKEVSFPSLLSHVARHLATTQFVVTNECSTLAWRNWLSPSHHLHKNLLKFIQYVHEVVMHGIGMLVERNCYVNLGDDFMGLIGCARTTDDAKGRTGKAKGIRSVMNLMFFELKHNFGETRRSQGLIWISCGNAAKWPVKLTWKGMINPRDKNGFWKIETFHVSAQDCRLHECTFISTSRNCKTELLSAASICVCTPTQTFATIQRANWSRTSKSTIASSYYLIESSHPHVGRANASRRITVLSSLFAHKLLTCTPLIHVYMAFHAIRHPFGMCFSVCNV